MIKFQLTPDLFEPEIITVHYDYPFDQKPVHLSIEKQCLGQKIYDLNMQVIDAYVDHYVTSRVNEIRHLSVVEKYKYKETILRHIVYIEDLIRRLRTINTPIAKLSFILISIIPESRYISPSDSMRHLKYLNRIDLFEKQMLSFYKALAGHDFKNDSKTHMTSTPRDTV